MKKAEETRINGYVVKTTFNPTQNLKDFDLRINVYRPVSKNNLEHRWAGSILKNERKYSGFLEDVRSGQGMLFSEHSNFYDAWVELTNKVKEATSEYRLK